MSFPDPYRRARRAAKVKHAPRRLLYKWSPRLLKRAQRRHMAQVERAIADGAQRVYSENPPKLVWVMKSRGHHDIEREETEPED